MKKITIAIGSLLMMSFSTHCIYKQYKLSTALDIVQDLRTWIGEDINNNRISPELGDFYIQNLDLVEDKVIDFCSANSITTVDFECDGYEIDSNGVVTNFDF